MDSGEIEQRQIRKFQADVLRQYRYLLRLKLRMDELNFAHADPLHLATIEALNAISTLKDVVGQLVCRLLDRKRR